MASLSATDVIAIYAAIIATAALSLEIRRWFESRPKCILTVNAPWKMRGNENDRFVVVTVINRGPDSFSIDTFAMLSFKTIWHRKGSLPEQLERFDFKSWKWKSTPIHSRSGKIMARHRRVR